MVCREKYIKILKAGILSSVDSFLKKVFCIGILSVFLGFAAMHISLECSFAQDAWTIQALDSTGDVGEHSSIAVDSSGSVHIAYRDSDHYRVKYATNSSGTWVVETPPEAHANSEGEYISIALDTSKGVHISHSGGGSGYPACIPGYLFYTRKIEDSWLASEPFSAGTDKYTSIAVDTSDNVHISYRSSSCVGDMSTFTCSCSDDVAYANNRSDSWQREYLNATGWPYKLADTPMTLDSNDNVHIGFWERVYSDGVWGYKLKHATNASGTWEYTVIDTQMDVGWWSSFGTSIAIDSHDGVHFSYYDADSFDLKYATNESGSWTVETVDSTGKVGAYSSVAIGSGDTLHISYYDETNGNLKYATNKSGSWTTETVDSIDDVGKYTSIGIDSQDTVHISYYDVTNADLKYASGTGSATGTESDSGGITGLLMLLLD